MTPRGRAIGSWAFQFGRKNMENTSRCALVRHERASRVVPSLPLLAPEVPRPRAASRPPRPTRHRLTVAREEEGEPARASLRGRRNEVRSSGVVSFQLPTAGSHRGHRRAGACRLRSEPLGDVVDERVRWKPANRGDVFGHISPHALPPARRPRKALSSWHATGLGLKSAGEHVPTRIRRPRSRTCGVRPVEHSAVRRTGHRSPVRQDRKAFSVRRRASFRKNRSRALQDSVYRSARTS
jgi:hypothetical protein